MEEITEVILKTSGQTNLTIAMEMEGYCSSAFFCTLLSPRKVRIEMDVIGTDAQQLLLDIVRIDCSAIFF